MIAQPGSGGNYRVDLQSVRALWDAACGPYQGDGQFYLSPGEVIERYEIAHRTEMTRESLGDWMAFESCLIDWDCRDFERMILGGIARDVQLLLITGEGLAEGSAFGFRRADFQEFAGWYEREYRMDFFQSADYIVFDRELTWLRVLHHEGLFFKGCRRELSK